ncbi:hypothetical protein F5Y14DRAFT_204302 [Nemania sp. NC0429]|nr:hypothetical protein F5Y14DRAFT_204302 [Nemania sp. NC0429]
MAAMGTPSLGLEIPAFGGSAALRAATLGATRIELNAEGSYGEGGLTPSLEDLKWFRSASTLEAKLPLRIMIRPRGPPVPKHGGTVVRDFRYSDEEFERMEASIGEFISSGLLDASRGDGFVFGILEEEDRDAEGDGHTGRRRCWVDKARCAHLVRASQPFKCVFHRAFDEIVSCDDDASDGSAGHSWETGLEAVAACGFHGILTSGGLGKAIDNTEMLGRIIQRAQVLQIEIIVGGGVRTVNAGELVRRLELRGRADSVYLHSACLHGDGSEEINPSEVQGIISQSI